MPPHLHVALLRGINVGGRNIVPMGELRAECALLGWRNVRSYIQSGNVLFEAEGGAARLEGELEGLIARRFSLSIPVIIRTAGEWRAYTSGNPFPDASAGTPNLVMLALSKAPPLPDAVQRLRGAARDGERVERRGDALWIHFPEGAARSKLTTPLLDRLVGSPVTLRNWRTVLKLEEMMRGSAGG